MTLALCCALPLNQVKDRAQTVAKQNFYTAGQPPLYQCLCAVATPESQMLFTLQDNLRCDRKGPLMLCDLKMVLDLLGLSTVSAQCKLNPLGIL